MTVSILSRRGDTLWRYGENMTTFFWHHDETHVLFYVGAARCSKTVSNHYLSPFCAPFSVQSAFSLGNFINYECWVEDPNKDFLLLKFSCFSTYNWDICQAWQGIAETKIISYVGWTIAKRFQGFLKDPECMSQYAKWRIDGCNFMPVLWLLSYRGDMELNSVGGKSELSSISDSTSNNILFVAEWSKT